MVNRERLIQLINTARTLLPESHREILLQRLESSIELANAGEEGVAFECLCDNLHEFDVQISQDFLKVMEDIGSYFGIPSERYNFIRELAQ
jgi:hypothetical protein